MSWLTLPVAIHENLSLTLFLIIGIAFSAFLLWQVALHAWRHEEHRVYLWLVIQLFTIVLIVVIALQFVVKDQTDGPKAVLITGLLAAVGWILTNHNNNKNSRASANAALERHSKQHTLNTILQFRLSETVRRHRMKIHAHFPPGTSVSCPFHIEKIYADYEQADQYQADDNPVLESIIYICNFYDYMSLSVKSQDLDEKMIKLSFRGLMVGTMNKFGPLIGHMVIIQPKAYENYIWLLNRWGYQTGEMMQDKCTGKRYTCLAPDPSLSCTKAKVSPVQKGNCAETETAAETTETSRQAGKPTPA